MKKPKKKTYAQLKKELDIIFSRWFKLSRADTDGYLICFTCGVRRHIDERMQNNVPYMQTGHYNRAPHLLTRWDEKNCRIQCWYCNCALDGNYDIFTLRLIDQIGRGAVDELTAKRHKSPKIPTTKLQEDIDHYKKLLTFFNDLR